MPKGPSKSASRLNHHDTSLKTRILNACARGDRSIAAVARAHGVSAQRVYQWRHDAACAQADGSDGFKRIELSAVAPASPNAHDFIRVELARSDQSIRLHWPMAHASALIAWLDQP